MHTAKGMAMQNAAMRNMKGIWDMSVGTRCVAARRGIWVGRQICNLVRPHAAHNRGGGNRNSTERRRTKPIALSCGGVIHPPNNTKHLHAHKSTTIPTAITCLAMPHAVAAPVPDPLAITPLPALAPAVRNKPQPAPAAADDVDDVDAATAVAFREASEKR